MSTRIAALVVATSIATAGCAHKQLSNRQVAVAAVTVGAVIGLVVLLSLANECQQKYSIEECGEPQVP